MAGRLLASGPAEQVDERENATGLLLMTWAAHRPPAEAIRPATASDWERIAALLSASALPLEGARDHIGGFVVMERDGDLLGCAAVERYGSAALLRSVAVMASERGRGTGAALIERCLADAARKGGTTMVLLTTTAERYFCRFGFEVIDRIQAPESVHASAEFQGACPSSAVVMQLTLPRRPGSLVIRSARREDVPAIAAIYNAGIRGRMATFETRERAPEDIETWFANDRYPILVGERDGGVVGWIVASCYRSRDCYAGVAEFSVYVDPPEQRRGAGDFLMRELLQELERRGFWKVLSRIFPENAASRALCRRHGFREVGVYQRHARLDGAWREVVIVERLLGDAARS